MRAPMMFRAALWVLGAALLASCGSDDASGEVLESDGRYVLTAPFDSTNVAGVGISGEVEMVGECLGINGQVVIWPEGTEVVSSEPFSVEVPGVGRVAEGDPVVGGGNSASPPEGLDVPADCHSASMTYFFAE